jgi:hypothetical protein
MPGRQKHLALLRSILRPITSTHPQPSSVHVFSILEHPPKYPGHVSLTLVQRLALAVGSVVTSLFNSRLAGMIAALSEP